MYCFLVIGINLLIIRKKHYQHLKNAYLAKHM